MFDLNEAFADQVIRAAHGQKDTDRGAFQTGMHPLNARGRSASAGAMGTAVTSGFRDTRARLAALFSARHGAQEDCCPATA